MDFRIPRLSLVIAATAVFLVEGANPAALAQYRVVGYYPMWAAGTLSPGAIRYDELTHVIHAFSWPNSDGSLALGEAVVDTGLINATHRAGRKILLSFGGAGSTQAANFAVVAADSGLRRKFIANVVAHLAAYHYDGADLDWEGPASTADRVNEVALVRGLRAAFNAADSTLLITMAVGVSDWSGRWRDFASLVPVVDWFNAMTYDFYGSWSSQTGHNAPLYAPPGNTEGSDDQGIYYLAVTRGIPRAQLVLGLPFYGKEFTGTSTLYSAFTGEQDLAYYDIVALAKNGWTYHWDNVSMVPYFTNASVPGIMTFDDSLSLATKCKYAIDSNLSGVMIWEITQDVLQAGQPLMTAVGLAMTSTAGISPTGTAPVAGAFRLFDSFPNPFNPSTTIRFALPRRSTVRLEVYNTLGQKVSALLGGTLEAGVHEVKFDGSAYASGMYVVRMVADGFMQSKTLLLLK